MALGFNYYWVMFTLREVELASTRINDVTINATDKIVTWALPTSKTDPESKGCARRWGYVCRYAVETCAVCPYCIAVLIMTAGPKRKPSEFLRITSAGNQCTKRAMIQ